MRLSHPSGKVSEKTKNSGSNHAGDLGFSLRDVERLAKENNLGAELSSGYLSMLERDEVKQPSPRILFALAKIYEKDYIDLMKQVGYIPESAKIGMPRRPGFAFRGTSRLTDEQKDRIQMQIDFELSRLDQSKRKRGK